MTADALDGDEVNHAGNKENIGCFWEEHKVTVKNTLSSSSNVCSFRFTSSQSSTQLSCHRTRDAGTLTRRLTVRLLARRRGAGRH